MCYNAHRQRVRTIKGKEPPAISLHFALTSSIAWNSACDEHHSIRNHRRGREGHCGRASGKSTHRVAATVVFQALQRSGEGSVSKVVHQVRLWALSRFGRSVTKAKTHTLGFPEPSPTEQLPTTTNQQPITPPKSSTMSSFEPVVVYVYHSRTTPTARWTAEHPRRRHHNKLFGIGTLANFT
jgi:hypothetical protein